MLYDYYLWLKAIHIMSIVTWMAGIFYLPRLFVYHSYEEVGSKTSETFKVMEYKLLKFIMTPSMIVAWIFGTLLVLAIDIDWSQGWFRETFDGHFNECVSWLVCQTDPNICP